jgi:small-conductance mechanosensitive channel
MQQLLPYSQWLHTQSSVMYSWMVEHVLVWSTFVQLSMVLLLYVASQVLSRHSALWLENKLKDSQRKSLIRLYVSYQELFFLFYLVLFSWCAAIIAQGSGLSSGLLHIVASLTTAWAVIRFTSSTIKSPFWSRLIALTLWILAALNIVGWLGHAITIMNDAAVTVGGVRLSLLLVLKSLLAFAVLLWAIGFVSGVLERSFNKAHGLNPSQRVLFFKLSNILLYAIGCIVGLNIVGLDLTALTVFSGALGLGIGFGLQKVFSNLISGIILLLDKSVKPGDVIAIGDTYGWVNSLGARCVSVLTRDGKEHLIPNENLITQEVENWSYSDRMVRLHIPIGVSYHSDLHLVRKLLLQAVEEHPRILDTPAPNCLITGFGDNSVDHELRLWIGDPQAGVSNVRSEIYYKIWDLFKAHGVEIPFPQRDVHLKLDADDVLLELLKQRAAK